MRARRTTGASCGRDARCTGRRAEEEAGAVVLRDGS